MAQGGSLYYTGLQPRRQHHEDNRLQLGVRAFHPRQAQGEAISLGTEGSLRTSTQPCAQREGCCSLVARGQ